MATLKVNGNEYTVNNVQGDKRTNDNGEPTKHTLTFDLESDVDQNLLNYEGELDDDVEFRVVYDELNLHYVGTPYKVVMQTFEGTTQNQFGEMNGSVAKITFAIICDLDSYRYIAK